MQQVSISEHALETMGSREIGSLMAQQRARFNLTQQEVSERLHIRMRYVGAMEEGRFDLMPGKVYARGYVHTYAEFLGLDAPLVVARCFADDPALSLVRAPKVIPRISAASPRWSGYGAIGIITLLAMLLISQISGNLDSSSSDETAIAPVPESMLNNMRTLTMPTAANYECLMEDLALGCFYTDSTLRGLTTGYRPLFMEDIDLASMALPPPADPEPKLEEYPAITAPVEPAPVADSARYLNTPPPAPVAMEKPLETQADEVSGGDDE